jgi:hypothetical protein
VKTRVIVRQARIRQCKNLGNTRAEGLKASATHNKADMAMAYKDARGILCIAGSGIKDLFWLFHNIS